ncbi:MAG: iron uptake transporter permease EfeU [Actinomycetaceae bacterium]|nr:iron uptake transporter permease EfeU [Actinomycetaceae bacterium]
MSSEFIGNFFPNFLIALREGVEAALIVGILVAYLVRSGRRDVLPKLWLGVAIAIAIPFGAGIYMTWGPYTLSFQAQEILGGVLSLIAVGFVTWMILWMGKNSRQIAGELEGAADTALQSGSARAIVWLAIIAVGREGVETALFVWSVVKSSASSGVAAPALGVFGGLLVAVAIGYVIYKGSVRFNLRLFFLVTGYLLVFVAAGIVAYGIGDLHEADVLPGQGRHLYDHSALIAGHASSWWFAILNAMFNVEILFSPTLLQFIGWAAYLVVVLTVFTVQARGRRSGEAPSNGADNEPSDNGGEPSSRGEDRPLDGATLDNEPSNVLTTNPSTLRNNP